MILKSNPRARKTKVAQATDVPFVEVKPAPQPSFFEQCANDSGYPGTSVKRYLAALTVSLLAGYALGTYVLGPVLAAFVIGAALLSWPWFIILIGYVLAMCVGLYYGSKVCAYAADLVMAKKIDAMYFITRDKVSGLFNFRKEVTS